MVKIQGRDRRFYNKCATCGHEVTKQYIDKGRLIFRSYCTECEKIRNRQYERDHPNKVARNFKNNISKYGITPEQYWQLVAEQDQVCAICGKDPADRLYVDHDKNTNKIRGLLCHPCNLMLGFADENPDWLRAGALYLERLRVES